LTALPVLRGLPSFTVADTLCADAVALYRVGVKVYTATGAKAGQFTVTAGSASTAGSVAVGIVTHTPTTPEPFLGIASLI
jgi:hypothetical protein